MFIQAINTFLYLIGLNMMLFLFNLLPLPPLDGYRIVQDLLPHEQRIKLQQYEQWAIYFFLLMVFLPPLYRFCFGPYLSLQNPILQWHGKHIYVRYLAILPQISVELSAVSFM